MKKILIVDDEADVGNLLAESVRQQGHEATVATSGAEALALLRQHSYEAVFLDVLMPKMSGIEVLRQLRGFRPTLPVILITGHAVPKELEEARQLGVTEIIKKPFALKHLAAALEGQKGGGGEPGAPR